MSSISGASSATSSLTPAQAAQQAAAAAQAELAAAGQSLISGSTGNTSMDIQSIVTALVNSKVAGQEASLTAEAANDNTQISAIGQLSAALAQLQVGLAPLFNGQLASTFDATVSGTGISATASTGSTTGSYTLNVSQIAQGQRLTSGAFDSTDANAMGTGTLTINVGGKSMSVDVTSGNDTLSDIKDAINSASDNPGVTASIITGAGGTQYLTLTATGTGASSTINVAVSGASSGAALSNLAVTSTQASTVSASGTTSTSSTFTTSQSSGVLGSGSVTVTIGGQTQTFNLDSSNDTLSGLASAINSWSGLPADVTATVSGNQLVFSTTDAAGSAAANAASGATLTTNLGSAISSGNGWTQNAAAQDAELTVNGIPASSSTNSVTGVLDGVTLSLGTSTPLNTDETLSISPDNSTIESDITTFVSEYNTVVSTIASLTSFNSAGTAGSQGGPLLGDSMINQIESTFGSIVGAKVTSGGVSATLSQLGITLNADGTLSVDTTTLDNAVQNNPAQVTALFNSTNGIGQQLNSQINTFTQSGGIIDVRNNQLTTDLQSVTTQTTQLQSYIQQLTTQYSDQFNALNTLMSTTTSESTYLTALFGGTNSSGTLNSSGG